MLAVGRSIRVSASAWPTGRAGGPAPPRRGIAREPGGIIRHRQGERLTGLVGAIGQSAQAEHGQGAGGGPAGCTSAPARSAAWWPAPAGAPAGRSAPRLAASPVTSAHAAGAEDSAARDKARETPAWQTNERSRRHQIWSVAGETWRDDVAIQSSDRIGGMLRARGVGPALRQPPRRSTHATASSPWASISVAPRSRSMWRRTALTAQFRFENDALLGLRRGIRPADAAARSLAAAATVLPRHFEGDLHQGRPRARGRRRLWRRRQHRQLSARQARPRPREPPCRQGSARTRSTRWRLCCGCAPGSIRRPKGADSGAARSSTAASATTRRLRYLGLTQLADDGGSTPAHRVCLRLRGRVGAERGYRQARAGAGGTEAARCELAVSADGRYVPLRLDGSLDGLPISAVLAGDCAGPSGCAAAE